MSVKTKVKRCNKEIRRLENELQTERLSNRRYNQKYIEQLENIVKFALTNHIGNLKCGMRIESYGIDKMKDLNLSIGFDPQFHSYTIRVTY